MCHPPESLLATALAQLHGCGDGLWDVRVEIEGEHFCQQACLIGARVIVPIALMVSRVCGGKISARSESWQERGQVGF